MKNKIIELLNKVGIDPNKKLFGMYFWESQKGYELRERINDLDGLCECLEKCVGGCDDDPEKVGSCIEEYGSRPYDSNGNELDVKIWMFAIDEAVVVVTDNEDEYYKYCAHEISAIMNDCAIADDKCRMWLVKNWLEMLDLE